MKIILEECDRIDGHTTNELSSFVVNLKEIHKANYVVYHNDNKATIIKNRYDGFHGECSLEKSLEYLRK